MFSSIFKNAAQITTNEVLICAAVALAIGIALAVCYLLIENAKRGFTVTLLLLPIICDGIIMLVNGFATNGLSLAITLAGVFALRTCLGKGYFVNYDCAPCRPCLRYGKNLLCPSFLHSIGSRYRNLLLHSRTPPQRTRTRIEN